MRGKSGGAAAACRLTIERANGLTVPADGQFYCFPHAKSFIPEHLFIQHPRDPMFQPTQVNEPIPLQTGNWHLYGG